MRFVKVILHSPLAATLLLVAGICTEQIPAQDLSPASWHESEVTGLAFGPEGRRLLSTSLRDDRLTSVDWDAQTSKFVTSDLGEVSGARSHAVAFGPKNGHVAIAGFRVMALYDVENGKQIWSIDTLLDEYSPPYMTALSFSPDGKWLATSGSASKVGGPHGYKGGLVTIREAKSGKSIHRFEDLPHGVECVAFSPDGNLLAAGTNGASGELPEPGELRIWDPATGRLLHLLRSTDKVQPGDNRQSASGLAFSPDSSRIAVASSDGAIRVWDVAKGELQILLAGHERTARRVAFSPDGRWIASGGQDRTIRVWNSLSGKQVASFTVKSPNINAVTFSPNGKWHAAAGGNFLKSGEVQVWNIDARFE